MAAQVKLLASWLLFASSFAAPVLVDQLDSYQVLSIASDFLHIQNQQNQKKGSKVPRRRPGGRTLFEYHPLEVSISLEISGRNLTSLLRLKESLFHANYSELSLSYERGAEATNDREATSSGGGESNSVAAGPFVNCYYYGSLVELPTAAAAPAVVGTASLNTCHGGGRFRGVLFLHPRPQAPTGDPSTNPEGAFIIAIEPAARALRPTQLAGLPTQDMGSSGSSEFSGWARREGWQRQWHVAFTVDDMKREHVPHGTCKHNPHARRDPHTAQDGDKQRAPDTQAHPRSASAHAITPSVIEQVLSGAEFPRQAASGAEALHGEATKWVELMVVNDFSRYSKLEDLTQRDTASLVSIVDDLYRNGPFPHPMRVVLTGQITWTSQDAVPFRVLPGENCPGCTANEYGVDMLLNSFLQWHESSAEVDQLPSHDTVHMLSDLDFEGAIVGYAGVGVICFKSQSGGVEQVSSSNQFFNAGILAHEMGHNLGMSHDGDGNKCPQTGFIMNRVVTPGSPPTDWSSCSSSYLESLLAQPQQSKCLENEPVDHWGDPVCGNGFREQGEDCDCGFNLPCSDFGDRCCDGQTCKFLPGAQCSAVDECCDESTCSIVVSLQQVCRQAVSSCDVAETCDGRLAKCPADLFKGPGRRCGGGEQGVCYEGECWSMQAQCSSMDDRLPTGAPFTPCDAEISKANNRGNLCDTLFCRSATQSTGCTQFTAGEKSTKVWDGIPCGVGMQCLGNQCVESDSLSPNVAWKHTPWSSCSSCDEVQTRQQICKALINSQQGFDPVWVIVDSIYCPPQPETTRPCVNSTLHCIGGGRDGDKTGQLAWYELVGRQLFVLASLESSTGSFLHSLVPGGDHSKSLKRYAKAFVSGDASSEKLDSLSSSYWSAIWALSAYGVICLVLFITWMLYLQGSLQCCKNRAARWKVQRRARVGVPGSLDRQFLAEGRSDSSERPDEESRTGGAMVDVLDGSLDQAAGRKRQRRRSMRRCSCLGAVSFVAILITVAGLAFSGEASRALTDPAVSTFAIAASGIEEAAEESKLLSQSLQYIHRTLPSTLDGLETPFKLAVMLLQQEHYSFNRQLGAVVTHLIVDVKKEVSSGASAEPLTFKCGLCEDLSSKLIDFQQGIEGDGIALYNSVAFLTDAVNASLIEQQSQLQAVALAGEHILGNASDTLGAQVARFSALRETILNVNSARFVATFLLMSLPLVLVGLAACAAICGIDGKHSWKLFQSLFFCNTLTGVLACAALVLYLPLQSFVLDTCVVVKDVEKNPQLYYSPDVARAAQACLINASLLDTFNGSALVGGADLGVLLYAAVIGPRITQFDFNVTAIYDAEPLARLKKSLETQGARTFFGYDEASVKLMLQSLNSLADTYDPSHIKYTLDSTDASTVHLDKFPAEGSPSPRQQAQSYRDDITTNRVAVAWMDGEGAHMMSNATQLLGQASQLQTDAAALQQDILQMRAWLNSLVMAGGEVELLVHAGFLGDSYRNAKTSWCSSTAVSLSMICFLSFLLLACVCAPLAWLAVRMRPPKQRVATRVAHHHMRPLASWPEAWARGDGYSREASGEAGVARAMAESKREALVADPAMPSRRQFVLDQASMNSSGDARAKAPVEGGSSDSDESPEALLTREEARQKERRRDRARSDLKRSAIAAMEADNRRRQGPQAFSQRFDHDSHM